MEKIMEDLKVLSKLKDRFEKLLLQEGSAEKWFDSIMGQIRYYQMTQQKFPDAILLSFVLAQISGLWSKLEKNKQGVIENFIDSPDVKQTFFDYLESMVRQGQEAKQVVSVYLGLRAVALAKISGFWMRFPPKAKKELAQIINSKEFKNNWLASMRSGLKSITSQGGKYKGSAQSVLEAYWALINSSIWLKSDRMYCREFEQEIIEDEARSAVIQTCESKLAIPFAIDVYIELFVYLENYLTLIERKTKKV